MNDTIKAYAKEIVQKISELPSGAEFVIGGYFKDYYIKDKERFSLLREVLNQCKENNIEIENTQSGMILGMPWVYKYKKK